MSNQLLEENLGVSIIICNVKGEILLGERKNAYMSGYFGSPGGHVKLAESLHDACKRELEEETGVKIGEEQIEYIGVVRELQDQGSYNFIHFGFVIRDFTGIITNTEPHKCKGWEWFSQENLPGNILPGHKAVIDMVFHPNSIRMQDIV